MRYSSRKWSPKAGSVMVMFTLMLPFVLVPLVGLAIDGTMMYSVKAKLQAAVDGGAIAAAQSLNSGMTFTAQKATAEKTAHQFIRANIVTTAAGKTGYWGAYNLNDTNCDLNGQPVTGGAKPCVIAAEDNTNKRRTVAVNASVQVPLLFMRVLGFSSGTVTARGTAARRDVVMVLVLDRSSSMNNVINGVNVRDAMKDGAKYFVSQFQSTRDRLGLVVFGGSAIVAYPPADWGRPVSAGGLTLPGAAGPNTQFKDTPDSVVSPNILRSISSVQVASNTGTAEALWLAYLELKAANQPGALNAIVLFTDGHPNGISANFNSSLANAVIKGGSSCSYKPTDSGNAARSMIGWIAQWGGYATGNTNVHGIFALAQTDQSTQTSVLGWLSSTATEPVLLHASGQPGYKCTYAATTDGTDVASDLTIPGVDKYGNSTLGSGIAPYTTADYKQSAIWNDNDKCDKVGRVDLNLSKSNDSCHIGLASWNAADMAGRRIRADSTLKPVIYSMGFQGNGGADPVLLRRLANINVASNTVYESTFPDGTSKPQGMYIPIQVPNDITPAFQYVLSEILRLTL